MALVAAVVTVVLWASAFVGIRAAGEDLSPGALSLGRLAVGSALLGFGVEAAPGLAVGIVVLVAVPVLTYAFLASIWFLQVCADQLRGA